MNKDGPGAHCWLPSTKQCRGEEEAPACLLLLTAIYLTDALGGSVQASKSYYQIKQEGTTWEPYRAGANVCWAGEGGKHWEEATGEASI